MNNVRERELNLMNIKKDRQGVCLFYEKLIKSENTRVLYIIPCAQCCTKENCIYIYGDGGVCNVQRSVRLQ